MRILIFFITLFSIQLQSQVSFNASVSKNKLGLNERLRVDFVMNQNGDNFSPPNFENFQVIGGPNQSIKTSYVNGERSFSKTYSYFLQPLKKIFGFFSLQRNLQFLQSKMHKHLRRMMIKL